MRQMSKLIHKELAPLIAGIVEHPIHRGLDSIEDLRAFTQSHIFAAWDFMCLIKVLYKRIVCTESPWFPPVDAMSANLISSIMIEEEGDINEDGEHYDAHYNMYLRAMEDMGANTRPVKQFLSLLESGCSIQQALDIAQLPAGVKQFVKTTFSFFDKDVHEIASAFVFGREGLTSLIFLPIIDKIESGQISYPKQKLASMHYYLKRHIELDDNEHFPKALQMLENLVGDDKRKWMEVKEAAETALQARADFLTAIYNNIQRSNNLSRHARVIAHPNGGALTHRRSLRPAPMGV